MRSVGWKATHCSIRDFSGAEQDASCQMSSVSRMSRRARSPGSPRGGDGVGFGEEGEEPAAEADGGGGEEGEGGVFLLGEDPVEVGGEEVQLVEGEKLVHLRERG